MGYRRYTAQYKAKIVLEVLQGEKELGEIAAENNLNPNMVRNWKRNSWKTPAPRSKIPARRRRRQRRKRLLSAERLPGCSRPSGS